MKKIITLIVLMCVVMVLSVVAYADDYTTQETIKVEVNGERVVFDQQPIMVNDRTLVPIRKICDAIGAEIYYQEVDGSDMKIISIVKGDTLITMINGVYSPQYGVVGSWRINKYQIPDNDCEYREIYNCFETNNEMEVAPVIVNGRTCVPVRVISEYLGAQVDWVDETQTVKITMADTAFKRSPEKIAEIESFTMEQSYEIYYNLPEVVSSTEQYAMDVLESYNQRGKLFVYPLPDGLHDAYIYSDGSVDYVNTQTKEKVKSFPAVR